jgi:hypothetical protein
MLTLGIFSSYLYYCFFSMAAPSRCRRRQFPDLGMGSSPSPAERAVSDRPLSVVARLASRSLTGKGMGIEVHNHCAAHFHLAWKWGGSRRRCLRRTLRPDLEARRFQSGSVYGPPIRRGHVRVRSGPCRVSRQGTAVLARRVADRRPSRPFHVQSTVHVLGGLWGGGG